MSVKLASVVFFVVSMLTSQQSSRKFCTYNHAKTEATCFNVQSTPLQSINFENSLQKLVLKNVIGTLNFTGVSGLSEVTYLTISKSRIDDVVLDSLPNLVFLVILRNQKFPNLSQNLFGKCNESLNWLSLISNHHIIEEDSLHFLKNLTWLHLQNQKFKHLTGEFLKESTELHELTIRNCHLKKIDPDAFDNSQKLEILSLNFNKLDHLEDGTFKNLRKLKILELHHNNFVDFNLGQFGGLSSLEVLGLPSIFLKNIRNVDDLMKTLPGLKKMEVKKRDMIRNKILLDELRSRDVDVIGTPHDCHYHPCRHV